jgi:hypothetical protein
MSKKTWFGKKYKMSLLVAALALPLPLVGFAAGVPTEQDAINTLTHGININDNDASNIICKYAMVNNPGVFDTHEDLTGMCTALIGGGNSPPSLASTGCALQSFTCETPRSTSYEDLVATNCRLTANCYQGDSNYVPQCVQTTLSGTFKKMMSSKISNDGSGDITGSGVSASTPDPGDCFRFSPNPHPGN